MMETEEQRASQPCFIALCATCGKIIACVVKLPERAKDNAREVSKWVRAGLTVNTITVSEVHTGEWCECHRGRK